MVGVGREVSRVSRVGWFTIFGWIVYVRQSRFMIFYAWKSLTNNFGATKLAWHARPIYRRFFDYLEWISIVTTLAMLPISFNYLQRTRRIHMRYLNECSTEKRKNSKRKATPRVRIHDRIANLLPTATSTVNPIRRKLLVNLLSLSNNVQAERYMSLIYSISTPTRYIIRR